MEKEKVELTLVKVASLEHASWNPRSEEELAWDSPAMQELIASVKAGGITQSLAVWNCGKGKLVIAGNRRLEAAKAVGLSEVPAIVYTGISEARAHEITRAENEIRRGVDPLRDAELIGRMMDRGLSQKTIAAHFAMSEAMVCRRVKLLGLIEEVRQLVASKHNIATDALEQIALYPEDTQRECLATIKRVASRKDKDAVIRWGELKYDFNRQTRSLEGAMFDTSCCAKCAMRTGAQPDLWGDVPEDSKLGSCLKCDCYEKHLHDHYAGLVRDDVGDGVQLVDGEAAGFYAYQLKKRTEFSERKSKKCPVAWWWPPSYSGDELTIIWGPTLEAYRAILEAEDAEREAEAEAERNMSEKERAEHEAKVAELNRLDKERDALRSALVTAAEAISAHYSEMDDAKVVKLVKSAVIGAKFKGAAATLLAEVVATWFGDCATDEEDAIRLVVAFPAFAKALKVKAAELKAYQSAKKALADFVKKNYQGE